MKAKPSAPATSSPRLAKVGWRWSIALAVAALAWTGWCGLRLTRTLTPTTDESGHLAAGLSYWKNHNYALTTLNLFFTQKWAAWPLRHLEVPPFPDKAAQKKVHWDPNYLGDRFLESAPDDPRTILAPARHMTLILWLLTGAIVWAWSIRLGGPWAGALATLLYATSPVILSTAVLVTTDTGAAFWYLALLWAYAWLLNRPHAGSALVTGFCAGMMTLSKFSVAAWLLGALLLLGWHLWQQRGRVPLLKLVGWHLTAMFIAWLTIWTFFGWEFYPGDINCLGGYVPQTAFQKFVNVLYGWHFFPEPFFRELFFVENVLGPRPGYLFGEYRMGGHLLYFPVGFLVKSTLASLLALGLGTWFAVRPRALSPDKKPGASLAPLVCSAIGYGLMAIFTPVNIGIRHILPVFLIAAIVGGIGLARLGQAGRIRAAIAAAIALLAAGEGFSARLKPLAWFNAASGGPMNGYKIMVESSLDWGGDLDDLVAWQNALPPPERDLPAYLEYLGPPGTERYGVRAQDMSEGFRLGQIRPGYFIFSATRLLGGPGIHYGQDEASHTAEWQRAAPFWRQALPRPWNYCAVARVAYYCRSLQPTERIGPVFFVFRLDEKALETALGPQTP